MYDPWGECGREGVGRMEWSEGGKWDNCNSIINKYILKKKRNTKCWPGCVAIGHLMPWWECK